MVIELWWAMVGKIWWCGVYVVTEAAVLKECTNGRRIPEHCASHTQTNKQKSVRKGKVSMEVIVMVVMIGSRDVKEDVEARSMERGRKDKRKEGGVKVKKREQLTLRRLC